MTPCEWQLTAHVPEPPDPATVAGWDAHAAGQPAAANPHPVGTEAHRRWAWAWDEAAGHAELDALRASDPDADPDLFA